MKFLQRLTIAMGLLLPVQAGFEVKESDSRIEIVEDGKTVFGWQIKPPKEPLGGIEKFPISAYVHPLAPPSGFVLTDVQPHDHLHHLGVWWPWKQVTVDGKKHITWELQNGEGRHVAKSAEVNSKTDDAVAITAYNVAVSNQLGDQELRVLSARALSLRTVLIDFSSASQGESKASV